MFTGFIETSSKKNKKSRHYNLLLSFTICICTEFESRLKLAVLLEFSAIGAH